MQTTGFPNDESCKAAHASPASLETKLQQIREGRTRLGLGKETAILKKGGLPQFKVGVNAAVIPGNRAQQLLAADAT